MLGFKPTTKAYESSKITTRQEVFPWWGVEGSANS